MTDDDCDDSGFNDYICLSYEKIHKYKYHRLTTIPSK